MSRASNRASARYGRGMSSSSSAASRRRSQRMRTVTLVLVFALVASLAIGFAAVVFTR